MEMTENTSRQYLTFVLDEELYAVNVLRVKEVLDFTKVTRLPQTPGFMLGVINLRGSAVPVIDLRMKFAMDEAEITSDTSIIILEIEEDGGIVTVGVKVDAVKEVATFNLNEQEDPPKIGLSLNSEFITAMGKKDDDFVIMLDIDKIFSAKDLRSINSSSDTVVSDDNEIDEAAEGAKEINEESEEV